LAAAGARVEKKLNCLGAGYSSRTTTATTTAMAAAMEAAMAEMLAQRNEAEEEAPWLSKGGNAAMAFVKVDDALYIFSMTS
jgi:hypothetical protein